MKIFRFLFLTLFPVVSGVSTKCQKEFTALYESGTLEAKEAEATSGVDTSFGESNCNLYGDPISCTYDFSTVYDAIEPICKEVGGTMNKFSLSLSCTQEGKTGIEVTSENLPVCSSACCTAAEVLEILGREEDIANADQELVSQGFSCEISIDHSEGSDGEACEDSAVSLGQSSLLVSVAMSGLWWLYNL